MPTFLIKKFKLKIQYVFQGAKSIFGSALNNEKGDNFNGGNIHKGDNVNINLIGNKRFPTASQESLHSKLWRGMRDNECEKNEECSNCKVVVNLIFSEPIISKNGQYEIKDASCPNCQSVIIEGRRITIETSQGLFGKIDIKKSRSPWEKWERGSTISP